MDLATSTAWIPVAAGMDLTDGHNGGPASNVSMMPGFSHFFTLSYCEILLSVPINSDPINSPEELDMATSGATGSFNETADSSVAGGNSPPHSHPLTQGS